ncbi:MAG: RluA family pseudouridine synthase [Acidobacteriota bacterium]
MAAAPPCVSSSRGRPGLTEPQPGVVRYLTGPELTGERLDRAAAALTGLPRRRARALAQEGRLWLNGNATRVLSRTLRVGDVLDVIASGETLLAPRPTPPEVAVLFEDPWVVAVDKPPGMITQPGRERRPGELTAQERVLFQLALRDGRRPEVLLFHRLDRLTSGILVFARTHEAARGLAAAWGSGRAHKTYVAVVIGEPRHPVEVVEAPIGADPLSPGRQRVSSRGRPAISEIRALSTSGRFAVVEVRPRTGRTHQVRVHLAHVGLPVAGDVLYGGARTVPRPFLHAWRLAVPHPAARRQLRLEAPLPADMQAFLTEHGLSVERA